MIGSFRDKTTAAVFAGESPKGFPAGLVKVARRKLRYLNAAAELADLRAPPGNRLEALADELDAVSPGRAIVVPGDVGEPGANEAFVAPFQPGDRREVPGAAPQPA